MVGHDGKVFENLAVNSWKTGGKSLATLGLTDKVAHTAQSGAAVIAGTSVATVKQAAVTVGKGEAQPYIEQGKNTVMNGVHSALGGWAR
ncbi:MAG: hypothetical protein JWQ81_738 [Amycolatopsis sp.]|uniref:hypothetical protein n=1 Tax=Amycolatopsis sp. TaxID=37632 RepID=UPI002616809D|nr:hypothetical protein [Amycolatopsis sp.]MCU1679999.1 hypothetical protein [Amycolatopsis sp.]